MSKTNEKPLAGQRALITGGSSGIGAAIARAMAEAGAQVAVNHLSDPESAHSVVDAILANDGKALAIQADVSQAAEVKAMFRKVIQTWGSLDILVTNAGIQDDAPFTEMTLSQWEKVLAVNLTGQFLCAQEAVKAFLHRGIVPELSSAAGKIICISSVHDIIPWSERVNYAASKGGLLMFMKSLAQEVAHQKIRVNAISPGAIRTAINRSAWETSDAEAALLKLIPYERIGDTLDIARAAVWLASDASDYVIGTTLYVDGGMTLYPGFRQGG
ncbi:glucose 1-dehydrogenase [Nitrosomonas sp. ANs5]|uniref:glucose 1-dehydrogenase n=1 Tax=Nitrosomonas sp. ANs5 TaxID=3423941 RepID=UPI003D33789E